MKEEVSQRSTVAGLLLVQFILFAVGICGITWSGIEVGINTESWNDVIIGLAAGSFSYLVLLVVVRSSLLVANAMQRTAQTVQSIVSGFGVGAMAIVAFAAAIGEEFLFRVFLQGWIASLASPWIGVLVAASAFALAHATSVVYLLTSFVLGIAIGAAYEWNSSIIMIVCWHFSYDLLALAVLVKAPELLRIPQSSSPGA